MWHTKQSPYNIVDATPFGRDILKELADACHGNDVKLHLYYSHLDWTRPDYPQGRTGHTTGRDSTVSDWPRYYDFMNRQITELLQITDLWRAIWFDGWWDHDSDSIPFDWQLPAQYDMIHRLQPGCLIGNNHHQNPFEGEDIQIFERDVPGENTAGYSEQDISRLPLETCQTMNGMWGYKIVDTNYKDTTTLIRYLVKTAGQGQTYCSISGRNRMANFRQWLSNDSKAWVNGFAKTARRFTILPAADCQRQSGALQLIEVILLMFM